MKPGLTGKIKTILMPFYTCSVHREYHVFEKKAKAKQIV